MVAAIPHLLDVVTGSSSGSGTALPADEQTRIANELVAATLDEHAHIEVIDTYGPRGKSRRFLSPPTAAPFRKLHEDWLAQAEVLFARVKAMHDAGHDISRLKELTEALLLTRCLLKFTIESIKHGMEQIRRGDYVTLEEGRRELRAKAGR